MRRMAYAAAGAACVAGTSLAVSRLKPAAPVVERATIWIDEVKRGAMLSEVRGLGNLVPEEIRWIPATTDAVIDHIVLQPGAAVKPDSIILQLSNPQLQRDAQDAESQLKGAEADYQNLRVQIDNEALNQKAAVADARSQYDTAKLQSDLDEKMHAEGLKSEIDMQQSRIHTGQLSVHLQIEEERALNAQKSAEARLAAQQAHVEQQQSLYNQRRSQLDALCVRAGIQGVLESVLVEAGQRIGVGTNLARVADPKRLKAEIRVPEMEAKDVLLGLKTAVDTHNGIVAGHVARIDPAVQNGTVAVDIALDAPLPQGARPDLSVEGTIEIERLTNVLHVGRPVQAEANSTISIFKLTQNKAEAMRIPVRLGKGSVNSIEIREGLQAGDQIIVSDMSQWNSFERIRLK